MRVEYSEMQYYDTAAAVEIATDPALDFYSVAVERARACSSINDLARRLQCSASYSRDMSSLDAGAICWTAVAAAIMGCD